MMLNIELYRPALEAFLNDDEALAQALLTSTALVQHGGYLNVYFHQDGTYEVRNELAYDNPGGLALSVGSIEDEHLVYLHEEAGSAQDDTCINAIVHGECSWILDRARERLDLAFDRYNEDHERSQS